MEDVMKKKIIILFIALFSFILIPLNTSAKEKATVYLFRGKGCTYCRALLTYLNSINEEYGNYYELVSYEVWNNADNNELMQKISEFLDKPAEGVPYLIIGKEVFPGYYDGYNDSIKSAIKNLYEQDSKKRYDVLAEYQKENKLTKTYKTLDFEETLKEEGIEYNSPKKNKSNGTSSTSVIIWNLVFTTIATCGVVVFVNKKFKALEETIKNANKTTKVAKK
jgi:thiol-disulfide isomerase/thioredoxin